MFSDEHLPVQNPARCDESERPNKGHISNLRWFYWALHRTVLQQEKVTSVSVLAPTFCLSPGGVPFQLQVLIV